MNGRCTAAALSLPLVVAAGCRILEGHQAAVQWRDVM